MDSINNNQSEDNFETLTASKAVEKIQEIVDHAKTCFFCTRGSNGTWLNSRPMNVRKVDDDGTLWFLSANDSHKNLELSKDSAVKLFFQGSPHSDFMEISGSATILSDRAKIDELWMPLIKTWFTEGKDDPRISVIRVTPEDGYYWDNKHGNAIAGIKMMVGAALGKTMDDSVEGELKV